MCDPTRKNSATVVRLKSVGAKDMAATLVKSRTWSSAIRMMMAPRRASTDWMRGCPAAASMVQPPTFYLLLLPCYNNSLLNRVVS